MSRLIFILVFNLYLGWRNGGDFDFKPIILLSPRRLETRQSKESSRKSNRPSLLIDEQVHRISGNNGTSMSDVESVSRLQTDTLRSLISTFDDSSNGKIPIHETINLRNVCSQNDVIKWLQDEQVIVSRLPDKPTLTDVEKSIPKGSINTLSQEEKTLNIEKNSASLEVFEKFNRISTAERKIKREISLTLGDNILSNTSLIEIKTEQELVGDEYICSERQKLISNASGNRHVCVFIFTSKNVNFHYTFF